MAYDTLIAALLAEGEAKRKEILSKARAEADRLMAQAAADAAALEREADRRVREELAAQCAEALSRASIDRRRLLLQAKHEVLEAIWKRTTEMAMALTGHERARVLRGLLDELLDAAPPGPLTVIIDPRERPHLVPYLKSRNLAVEERSDDELLLGAEVVADGIMLRTSLATRLAKARPQLLIELNRLLFKQLTANSA
ncbi:MAG TPA: V-type ATP synthase subunit E [Nitrospiraceae bacterium]|jgi:vacuolar-type H+-ATPase subunit E/Vma4|nr:V-type ATP synthase subunit E [Nitrospiraceae bacterium]